MFDVDIRFEYTSKDLTYRCDVWKGMYKGDRRYNPPISLKEYVHNHMHGYPYETDLYHNTYKSVLQYYKG